jgi:hypothetical protein
VIIPLVFQFDADFRDMFEVRGARAARRRHDRKSTPVRHLPLRRPGQYPTPSVITFRSAGRLSATGRESYPCAPKRLELYIEIGPGGGQRPPASGSARSRPRPLRMRSRRRKGARLPPAACSATDREARAGPRPADHRMDTGPIPTPASPVLDLPAVTASSRLAGLVVRPPWPRFHLPAHQATRVSAFRDSAPARSARDRRGEMGPRRGAPSAAPWRSVPTPTPPARGGGLH